VLERDVLGIAPPGDGGADDGGADDGGAGGGVAGRGGAGTGHPDDGPWAVVDGTGALLAVYVPHRGTTVKPGVVLATA
jgi:hypothetical protein